MLIFLSSNWICIQTSRYAHPNSIVLKVQLQALFKVLDYCKPHVSGKRPIVLALLLTESVVFIYHLHNGSLARY